MKLKFFEQLDSGGRVLATWGFFPSGRGDNAYETIKIIRLSNGFTQVEYRFRKKIPSPRLSPLRPIDQQVFRRRFIQTLRQLEISGVSRLNGGSRQNKND